MATEKTFTVAGISTLSGKTKIRFANDVMRIKILAKNGHENVELVELPHAMTKPEIVAHLRSINFCGMTENVEAALKLVMKRNPTEAASQTTPVAETEAVPA